MINPETESNNQETIIAPVPEVVQPVMVSIDKAQLDTLIQRLSNAELKVAQFEQDINDIVKISGYLFATIQQADGLMSLVPVGKLSKALMQGKMPSFSAEEIQKLLRKAKTKIVKDDNFGLAVGHLITIYNRYSPIAGGIAIPENFKTEIENVLS